MKGTLQSDRLTIQQKAAEGVLGIFDEEAQQHIKKCQTIQKLQCVNCKRNFLC